jgi:hypothetical protein
MLNVPTNNNVNFGAVPHSMAFVPNTYFLCVFLPSLHDIYYQQYYEDLKRECVTVVLAV